MTKKPLHVLVLEDSPSDAELVIRELKRAGFDVHWTRVETEADYLAQLDKQVDLILSDYAMPDFDGLRALRLLKQRKLDIPFILVSGTIGEEMAVAAMRDGADDYLLKDRLARVGQAVDHALAQKRAREERKTAEAEVKRLTGLHELILNSAAEGIYGIDLSGKIRFVNPKAAELLRWERSDLIGKPAHTTMHHSHANGAPYPLESCPIYMCMRDGGTRRVTNDVFWRKDATYFRADYVAAPTRDAEGKMIGCIVTFRDNTEQFVAEERLKLQEQQYRLLFQTNPNPMWVFEVSTLRILAANDAAVAQYGYSKEEFLKLSLSDLRVAEERDKLRAALSTPGAPAHFSGEFEHVRKDSSRFNVAIYSSPVVWNGVLARIVTAIDVTERRQAEARLREQAEMLDHAHDAIIVRDFVTRLITFWNKGAERLYGWTAGEAIGKEIQKLIRLDPEEFNKSSTDLAATGEFRGQIKACNKDGRQVIADTWSTVVGDSDGKPRAVLSIHTDITEQKKLEQQFLRAQRLESIGTLASGVAHDLNNIITPIMMSAPMLRDPQDDETREKLLDLIEESANRGAKLVNQVLTFARGIEGERVLLQPQHLIGEVAKIGSQTFPKNITLRTSYDEDVWPLEGDVTQLHQVLLNLCVNARDAMPEGGVLTLAAQNFTVDPSFAAMMPGASAGPHVLLTVTDTGTGIPRDIVDKIFDPFFTTKEIGKGTGLGLSTVLGIVKSHGGFLNVYSEPGSGTTFKIFLPAAPHLEQQAPAAAAEHRFDGNGETILVVDDEEPIRRVTQTMLSQHNYHALTAADGPEALALFAQQMENVQVVLTDISMPYMDGVTLARALKRMKPNVRVVASTGRTDDPRIGELDAAGVAACLSKPYNTVRLLETLHGLLAPS